MSDPEETLKKLGEEGVIDLFAGTPPRSPVIKGIGDDCAVLGPFDGDALVWTADLLTEDVHFRSRSTGPEDLGYKALAVNLSDIAAMGAAPVAALLAVALPPDTRIDWLERFRDGFFEAAKRYECQVIGGDTCASSGPVTISVTVIGRVAAELVLYRSGAQADDDIWLSGAPGRSALGLEIIEAERTARNEREREAVVRHRRPEPRFDIARPLGQRRLASAAIDTSDGVVRDLARICEARMSGAAIEESRLLEAAGEGVSFELALHGGEDYQLLFTSAPENRDDVAALGDVTRIGRIISNKPEIVLIRRDGSREMLKAAGFEHF